VVADHIQADKQTLVDRELQTKVMLAEVTVDLLVPPTQLVAVAVQDKLVLMLLVTHKLVMVEMVFPLQFLARQ
jgi:hypothetical protein